MMVYSVNMKAKRGALYDESLETEIMSAGGWEWAGKAGKVGHGL